MDNNDPQLLGDAILQLSSEGIPVGKAADIIYDRQAREGWFYGGGERGVLRDAPGPRDTRPTDGPSRPPNSAQEPS